MNLRKFFTKIKFTISCLNFDDYEFMSYLNDKKFKIIGMNKVF